MGLDNDFLTMLEARVTVHRYFGTDLWGNDSYNAPTTERAYIDPTDNQYGTGDQGGIQQSRVATTNVITMDAVGVGIGDRIVFDTKDHWVTQVRTDKDEFGNDLMQTVTVSDQKEG